MTGLEAHDAGSLVAKLAATQRALEDTQDALARALQENEVHALVAAAARPASPSSPLLAESGSSGSDSDSGSELRSPELGGPAAAALEATSAVRAAMGALAAEAAAAVAARRGSRSDEGVGAAAATAAAVEIPPALVEAVDALIGQVHNMREEMVVLVRERDAARHLLSMSTKREAALAKSLRELKRSAMDGAFGAATTTSRAGGGGGHRQNQGGRPYPYGEDDDDDYDDDGDDVDVDGSPMSVSFGGGGGEGTYSYGGGGGAPRESSFQSLGEYHSRNPTAARSTRTKVARMKQAAALGKWREVAARGEGSGGGGPGRYSPSSPSLSSDRLSDRRSAGRLSLGRRSPGGGGGGGPRGPRRHVEGRNAFVGGGGAGELMEATADLEAELDAIVEDLSRVVPGVARLPPGRRHPQPPLTAYIP